ncbi:MAG: 5-formyltetrahydrofolate cyclo-ligase, partial [Bacteroidota bacterium]
MLKLSNLLFARYLFKKRKQQQEKVIAYMQKKQLRQQFRVKRKSLTAIVKQRYDESICTQLYEYIRANNHKTVHTYLPVGTEINLFPLITQLLNEGKMLVCPKTLKDRQLTHLILTDLSELVTGLYNTQHPLREQIYEGTYDLIIVPGLAFDRLGYRLGYGGGYYDTFLATHPQAQKVAAA